MSLLWVLTISAGYFCLILGVATKSRIRRTFIFCPLSLILFSRVAFFDAYAQPTPLDRLRPSAAGLNAIFHAVELLLCSKNPHTEFKRDADQGAKIGEQSFGRRMKWATALCGSQRGAGWNWRVTGTPTSLPPSTPKSSFILSCLTRYVTAIISLEFTSFIFSHIGPRTTLEGSFVLLHGVIIYISVHATYQPGCIIWVLAGLGGVEECAPIFGSWKDARSLRGFWGKSWYQGFRRPITVIPNRFLEVFGLGPDTTGISAFFMTGMYHALTVHAISLGTLYPKTFLFFVLQPLGFFIERYIPRVHNWGRQDVSEIHSRPNLSNEHANDVVSQATSDDTTSMHQTVPSYLGYFWVLIYLIITSRLYFSEMVDAGFYEEARLGGDRWTPFRILSFSD